DREDETGEAGEGQRDAEGDERGVGDHPVRTERHGGQRAEEAVDDGDEECGGGGPDEGRLHARVDGRRAERRADGPLLDDLDGYGQGPALDEQRQVTRLVRAERTGDLGGPGRQSGPAADRGVDLR